MTRWVGGLAAAAIALAGMWAAYQQSQQVPAETQAGGVPEETMAVDALTDDLMLGPSPEQAARTGQMSRDPATPEAIGLAGDVIGAWPADGALDQGSANVMGPDPTVIAPPTAPPPDE